MAPPGRTASGVDLWQLDAQLSGARVVALHPQQLVAALQHPVERFDQEGDCFVALVGLDGRVHIWPVDLDVTLGGKLYPGGGATVAGEFHPDPDDPFVVTKQSSGLLVHERLQGGGEFKMNAGDDDFVVVLAVHDAAFGFLCAVPGRGPEP